MKFMMLESANGLAKLSQSIPHIINRTLKKTSNADSSLTKLMREYYNFCATEGMYASCSAIRLSPRGNADTECCLQLGTCKQFCNVSAKQNEF